MWRGKEVSAREGASVFPDGTLEGGVEGEEVMSSVLNVMSLR